MSWSNRASRSHRSSRWSDLIRQDDWWAIWIGLGLVVVATALFSGGDSIKWIAVAPQKWSHWSDALAQLREHGSQYAALFVLLASQLTVAPGTLAAAPAAAAAVASATRLFLAGRAARRCLTTRAALAGH